MLTKRDLFDLVHKTYPCTKTSVVDNRQDYKQAVLSCLTKQFPCATEVDLNHFVNVFCTKIAKLLLQHGKKVSNMLDSQRHADFFNNVVEFSSAANVQPNPKHESKKVQTQFSWLRHLSRYNNSGYKFLITILWS